jgi:hypothetical protein
MGISEVETTSSINLLSLQDSKKPDSIKSNNLNEISDSFSESDETQKFKEIAGKYDITNISRNEFNEMYKELYDNKLISLKDMLVTLDPTRVPGWKDGVSSISGWKVSSDPDKKMNFLEGLKTQAEWYRKYGDSEFQDVYDKRLELAEKIRYFQSQ